MLRPLFSSLFLLLLLTGCGQEPEDTRPGQPVKHRRDAFNAILRSFEPMGTMLRKQHYQPDEFARLATELVSRRDAPWSYFGPDTNYPPTKAKATVWSKPEAFEKEKQAFIAATDELLAAAKTKDPAKVQAAYDRTYSTCKSCHREFRN